MTDIIHLVIPEREEHILAPSDTYRHAPNSNCSSKFEPNGSGLGSGSGRVRVGDLKFGFGFEFENYPINLASIECLSGSPSIFFVIRHLL